MISVTTSIKISTVVERHDVLLTRGFGNQSTRHTVKSCDELTVVSDGVVTS